MKILIVTQYFYPENFKSNDLAFELQKRGHEVSVLTGLPNYPEGNIYPGYGFFKKSDRKINGVKVFRTWLFPRGRGGGVRLFLNYFSWAILASVRAFFLSFNNKFDAVIVHEPSPITQGFPAIVIKKMQKIPMYFWVLDLWPESLVSGGISNSKIISLFTKIVRFIYDRSDKILISSKGFEKSILEKGNYADKLIYFPNWAEDTISEGDIHHVIPDLPKGFKVIFAGNIGISQDMENLMNAAIELREHTKIKIILIGDGRSKDFVASFIRDNKLQETVFLLGKFPIEAMSAFFNQSDALLVCLKSEDVFNITVPAKIQAYMSASKPILAMMNGEGSQVIEEAKCGLSAPAGNFKKLSEIIFTMSELDKNTRDLMGKNGYLYYKKNYTLQSCIDNLEHILKKSL
ncbi:glycosyltransferase family 4 protein [Flavobacterium kingsejongi]|uniref:Glycosyltransferase WbuB n=1 Tax=Flavobacterium kingsejongi TaxID=1678728 RepID=A0A2S1LNY3_9FLAO|nr:glycosyltransferase family 4 protein [Flavobacterium kingsejongi]AWG25372.1 glycosyltransferase WbuB [Flavobacterium kingsejongi]